jgi:hypothetical protein
MNVNELRTGMVVKDRKGGVSMILLGVGGPGEKPRDILSGDDWCPLEGLKRFADNDDDYDFMEVWQPETNRSFLADGIKCTGKCIWKRGAIAREMTVKQIAKELGYSVKVVE